MCDMRQATVKPGLGDTSVILAIIKLEQNCHDFQASLDCMVSPKPASLGV